MFNWSTSCSLLEFSTLLKNLQLSDYHMKYASHMSYTSNKWIMHNHVNHPRYWNIQHKKMSNNTWKCQQVMSKVYKSHIKRAISLQNLQVFHSIIFDLAPWLTKDKAKQNHVFPFDTNEQESICKRAIHQI